MKHFIVYQIPSGIILRVGRCKDIEFELQPKVGEAVLEGDADDAADLVDISTKTILRGAREQ